VSWKSSKKAMMANSMIEEEYIATSKVVKEFIWMKKFFSELGMVPPIGGSIPLLCDNIGVITQAKEPRSHQKSKHILRKVSLD